MRTAVRMVTGDGQIEGGLKKDGAGGDKYLFFVQLEKREREGERERENEKENWVRV